MYSKTHCGFTVIQTVPGKRGGVKTHQRCRPFQSRQAAVDMLELLKKHEPDNAHQFHLLELVKEDL